MKASLQNESPYSVTKAHSQPGETFLAALKNIATAGAETSRAAIDDAKSTKPSLHKRFVYDPAKPHD